jgi:hypothetical protein
MVKEEDVDVRGSISIVSGRRRNRKRRRRGPPFWS